MIEIFIRANSNVFGTVKKKNIEQSAAESLTIKLKRWVQRLSKATEIKSPNDNDIEFIGILINILKLVE